MKTGFQVQLRFNITQYSIDKELMNSLVYFWAASLVVKSLWAIASHQKEIDLIFKLLSLKIYAIKLSLYFKVYLYKV